MKGFKAFKWMALSLTVGMAGCSLMGDADREYGPVDYSAPASMQSTKAADDTQQSAPKSSSSSSKEPVQKSTPGPKRSAAPAMPVIQ